RAEKLGPRGSHAGSKQRGPHANPKLVRRPDVPNAWGLPAWRDARYSRRIPVSLWQGVPASDETARSSRRAGDARRIDWIGTERLLPGGDDRGGAATKLLQDHSARDVAVPHHEQQRERGREPVARLHRSHHAGGAQQRQAELEARQIGRL